MEPALVITDISDLASHLDMLIPSGSKVFVLTDSNVAEHCLPELMAHVPAIEAAEIIELDPGEENKSLEIVTHLWAHLLENEADRKSVLINLGGGVICDLGGFVGATYKRGISVIHLPTSLMAMVDAALGGKTGIDFGGVKNSVGVFAPEISTLVYPYFLDSLPEPEWKSGWAEMLKHALIADPILWKDLKVFSTEVRPEIIALNIRIKEGIIQTDFHENAERKLLNFGHTIGHGIEAYYLAQGKTISHGECVAAGMLVETLLSVRFNDLSFKEMEEIKSAIYATVLLPSFEFPSFESILPFIKNDKKNAGQSLRFVLLQKIGEGHWNIAIDESEVKAAYEQVASE